jgi:Holliday junction resolvase RusA-like endonuclease
METHFVFSDTNEQAPDMGVFWEAQGGLLRTLKRLVQFNIIGDPIPGARPRMTRSGHTFMPKTTQLWMATCRQQIPDGLGSVEAPYYPKGIDVAVLLEVVCATIPRGDVDNYAKSVLDACTKRGVWHDDKQVKLLVVGKRKRWEGELPGVHVMIGEHPLGKALK